MDSFENTKNVEESEDVPKAVEGETVAELEESVDIPKAVEGETVAELEESEDIPKAVEGETVAELEESEDVPKAVEGETVAELEESEDVPKAFEGETVAELLGKPNWCNETLREATFTSLEQFEAELADWTQVIQQHLTEHDFNTFGDYVHLHRDFTRLGTATQKKPIDFYRDYEAKINPEHMNCTGLSRTLLKSLQQSSAEFGSYFALVSSEENIRLNLSNLCKYNFESSNAVKRHVLICLKFVLSPCGRKGCVLIDSGYSLTHPIVVMSDEACPHTGWFDAFRRRSSSVEQRQYKLLNEQFIQYEQRNINQTTGQIEPVPLMNLIYVEREYLSYESVTQKRSLLTQIHYWVIRNGQGIVAGIGSSVDKRSLSIRYEQPNETTTLVEHHFSLDQLDSAHVYRALSMVARCSARARSVRDQSSAVEHNFQMYLHTLQQFRRALHDNHFTREISALYNWIQHKQQQHIDHLSTD